MKRRNKQPFIDDGRVVANMNIEGMPGYRPSRRDGGFGLEIPPPSKKETRAVAWNAMVAALLIGAVFLGACALVILFCTQVWFR